MGSAKIIMTLWVRWKKPIMPLNELDLEDAENAQEIEGNTGDNYIHGVIILNRCNNSVFLYLKI